jgi:hypothetical protein
MAAKRCLSLKECPASRKKTSLGAMPGGPGSGRIRLLSGTRVVNQFLLGRALTGELGLDLPITALMVYNCNPVVACPEQDKVVVACPGRICSPCQRPVPDRHRPLRPARRRPLPDPVGQSRVPLLDRRNGGQLRGPGIPAGLP